LPERIKPEIWEFVHATRASAPATLTDMDILMAFVIATALQTNAVAETRHLPMDYTIPMVTNCLRDRIGDIRKIAYKAQRPRYKVVADNIIRWFRST
jgi:antitoxin component of RelBE/YafQ-DinJ toxin-antitoxin module